MQIDVQFIPLKELKDQYCRYRWESWNGNGLAMPTAEPIADGAVEFWSEDQAQAKEV